MRNKYPIKVFLGGFVNSTNSQNLNCRSLCKYLDTDKFEIYTLELKSGDLPSIKNTKNNLHVFTCNSPYKLSFYLAFFWGIRNANIAYLPKVEVWKWNNFLLKFFKRKSFKTDEGILNEKNLEDVKNAIGGIKNLRKFFTYTDKNYPISKLIGSYNNNVLSIKSHEKPLYLGCEIAAFLHTKKEINELKSIVFIGRLKERKGVYEIVELAKMFPQINFFLFGDGPEKNKLKQIIETNNMENLILKGTVSHKELADQLKKMHLHILPSRSEGFPKVTLETAAAGVPSIVYSDYGAAEWITHKENGFVLESLEDTIATINYLQENPQDLQAISINAIALAQNFDWKVLVKEWEEEIIKLYRSKV